jgi:hypothetical protein
LVPEIFVVFFCASCGHFEAKISCPSVKIRSSWQVGHLDEVQNEHFSKLATAGRRTRDLKNWSSNKAQTTTELWFIRGYIFLDYFCMYDG